MNEPSARVAYEAERPTERPRKASGALRQAVQAIAADLAHQVVPPGDLGELRRARPGDLGGPAFWKLAVRHLEPAGLLPAPDAPWRDDAERRWVVIVAGLVEMAGLHRRGLSLGRVLAESEVSEARFLRLLRASDDALLGAVRAVSHQLASAGRAVDWGDFAQLVVSDGKPWGDTVRRIIAEDFYRSPASRT